MNTKKKGDTLVDFQLRLFETGVVNVLNSNELKVLILLATESRKAASKDEEFGRVPMSWKMIQARSKLSEEGVTAGEAMKALTELGLFTRRKPSHGAFAYRVVPEQEDWNWELIGQRKSKLERGREDNIAQLEEARAKKRTPEDTEEEIAEWGRKLAKEEALRRSQI